MVRLGSAVAAGAADLLVVGLQAARQRRVDDGADVRLVDAHAEGDRRDHHLDAARQELLLHALASAPRPGRRGTRAQGKCRPSSAASAVACARVGA